MHSVLYTSYIAYNKSNNNSKKIPSLWKQALVKPVAKNNNPTDLSDFRPISLLSILSKILEKHMHIQIIEFLNKNNLISKIQSGFRKNHSTSTALTHLVDDFLRYIDSGKCICLVLLDFSKAFDTLDHSMLLAKLHYLGFSKIAIDLIGSYLNGRKQAVVIEDDGSRIISSFQSLNSGVPQGSILGPLLFTLYVSDISNVVTSCQIHQYADDSQIYKSFDLQDMQDALTLINRDLKKLLTIHLTII